MKKNVLTAATFLAASASLFAQTLTFSAPGYSGTKLFDATPGFTITGMGADVSGTLYYLETDSAYPAMDTILYKRTPVDGYLTATPLYDYGAAVYGSFVVAQGGKIYFGESSAGTIRSINPDGSSPTLIGNVTGNYDLAFSGAHAFVSANADTTFAHPQNKILSLNTGTGATATVLDATPDYSGPIEFDSSGALLYGVANGAIGGIYRFTADDLGAGPITLFPPNPPTPPEHRILANGNNQYLAFSGNSTLWQDDFSTLRTIDTTTLAMQTIAETTETLGLLDFSNSTLYASVTDFGTNRSAVFAITPEPSSALLVAVGMLLIPFGRRRMQLRLVASLELPCVMSQTSEP